MLKRHYKRWFNNLFLWLLFIMLGLSVNYKNFDASLFLIIAIPVTLTIDLYIDKFTR